jgi:KilA-N domain/P63C domain
MSDLILREYNGKKIRIREDRYVCLTDMAKASGKMYGNWRKTEPSQLYLAALSRSILLGIDLLIETVSSGPNSTRGTWAHPKVALRFAQWCSEEFAVQVDTWIDELLNTGSVSLKPGEKMYTLDMVVRREPAQWERMFSDEWIAEAEKITKWQWNWSCMGQWINDTCYSYLPTDVVEALRSLNPKNEEGRGRLHKHHQFLQPEIRDIVANHLNEVELLMKAANGNMDLFKLLMVNRYGRFRLTGEDELPLFKTQTVFIINAVA